MEYARCRYIVFIYADQLNYFIHISHQKTKKVRIQFCPGKLILNALSNIQFEHVVTLATKREAKHQSCEEQSSEVNPEIFSPISVRNQNYSP